MEFLIERQKSLSKNLANIVKKSNFDKKIAMKKILSILFLMIVFTSCSKVLYTHYDYQEVVYTYAKNSEQLADKDFKNLAKTFSPIVKEPQGENLVPPPGAYADYAYLMYKRGDRDEAKLYFEKEYLTYPESKVYVQSLMEKLGL
jgi:hypothetical protein